MKQQSKSTNIPMKVVVNLCRFILGAAFVFSGVVKAVDPVGTQIKLSDYLYAFGYGDLIDLGTLTIVACTLAGLEFLLGIYMLFGTYRRGTSLLLMVFMLFFTPFALYLAINNPVEDCGCFGDALVLTNWQTFGKNVFLLLLSVFIFIFKRYIVSLVSIARHWMVTLVAVIVIATFMVNNVFNLPSLDFRPYKVGTNLFEDVLLQMNPAISDFALWDKDNNDKTDEVLSNKDYTFLLVSDHLENASEAHLDLIDDVYDFCYKYGYRMYGLTSSGRGEVLNWIENTGAEYDFLYSDEIPLKTMVRSNPGLVLIKDGVIINKWSYSNIPNEEELSGPLDQIEIGSIPQLSVFERVMKVLMILFVPFLLVILIDRLKCKIHNS